MGHKHSSTGIIAGALAVARSEGIGQVTYGRVAKQLGIRDRTVVYYFPKKEDLILAVMQQIGAEMQALLAEAFSSTAKDHLELCRTAWPILANANTDPLFSLFFEGVGLAAAGREPFKSQIPMMMQAWVTWVMDFLEGDEKYRLEQAELTVAVLDGLILYRQTAGIEAADRVAKTMGILD